jgi:hypothetical protein
VNQRGHSLRGSSAAPACSAYGPFLGAGIRVDHASPALDRIRVRMPLRWWNRNLLGTHFGGSLYAMFDPFFLWMLMEHLGPGYVVWDKAATIRFRRPGRGPVTAEFVMPPDRVAAIRAAADADRKVEPTFTAQVVDDNTRWSPRSTSSSTSAVRRQRPTARVRAQPDRSWTRRPWLRNCNRWHGRRPGGEPGAHPDDDPAARAHRYGKATR